MEQFPCTDFALIASDWSIVPIKYCSLSTVCTSCTVAQYYFTYILCEIVPYCTVLQEYCTKQLIL